MESLSIFLFLSAIVAVITVIGHLFWLLFAAVFRVIAGREGKSTQPKRCPVCAAFILAHNVSCASCGWSKTPRLNRLIITKKQVDELVRLGELTPAEQQRIFSALSVASHRTLGAQGSSPAATAVPLTPKETAAAKSDEVVSAELISPAAQPATRTTASPETVPPPLSSQADVRGPSGELQEQTPTSEPSELTPAERVRQFTERRQRAAAEPKPSPPPAPPSRAWHELVAAFMEERNMRWGELVGGLLIVGSSIALVVSLWSQIAERPIIKFGVFNGVTAALFGLGIHASRRWKLPTTSQGLLIIATLLVPLNFLAIVAFNTAADAQPALAIVGEVTSVIVFGALLYFSSCIVLPKWPWVLTAGVLGQAVMEIIIGRNVTASSALWLLYATGGACLLGYLVANVPTFLRQPDDEQSPDEWAHQIFKLLGITTFSVVLPLGLLLFRTGNAAEQTHRLSPLLVLLGVPGLATGIFLWQQSPLTWVRVTGASVAAGGAYLTLMSLLFAWPDPVWLLTTSLLNFAVLTGIAVSSRVPPAHLVAAPCVALAFVLAGHLTVGTIGWDVESGIETVRALLSAETGRMLVGFVAIYGLATWGWQRAQRQTESRYCAAVAGTGAVVSLALVSVYGFGVVGDPVGVTWVYLIYALCAFVAAYCARNTMVAAVATGLLLPALLQGIVYRYGPRWELSHPWECALLCHAALAACGALAARYRERETQQTFVTPLIGWAMLSSLVVVGVALQSAVLKGDIISASYLFWLALVWLVIAWAKSWPGMFAAFQAMLTVAVVRVVYARLETAEWYASLANAWCDPWTLEYVGIALVMLGLFWIGLRRGLRFVGVARLPGQSSSTLPGENRTWKEIAATLLHPDWPTWDQFVAGGVVILLSSLAVYGVVPGVAQELAPRISGTGVTASATVEQRAVGGRMVPTSESFELAGIPHDHALSHATWVFWAATLVLFAVSLAEEYRYWKLSAVALTFSTATLLLAGQWEAQVAVASALRWVTAAFFAVGSVVIWCRQPLLAGGKRLGWMVPQGRAASFSSTFALLVVLSVAPLVAMATFVALAAVSLSPPSSDAAGAMWVLSIVFCVSALVGLSIRIATARAGAARDDHWLSASTPMLGHVSTLLLVLGAAPLVAMTLLVVGSALAAHPIVGPNPDSFFSRIGLSASYAVPLLVIALAVVGHAVRERSERIALAAGLLLSFCATAAYLLSPTSTGQLDALRWIRVAQLNAIVAGVYGILWVLALLRVRPSGDRAVFAGSLMTTQIALGAAFAVLGFVPALAHLFWIPDTTFSLQSVAGIWGWLTLAVVIASLVGLQRVAGRPSWAAIRGTVLAAAAVLAAMEAHRWDQGDWLAYHTLLVMSLLGSAGVLATGLFSESTESRRLVTPWATLLWIGAVVFSVRAVTGDPQYPWWSVGGLVGSSLMAASLACWALMRRYLYAAGMLFNLAASVWWIGAGHKLVSGRLPGTLIDFIHINVVALALPAVAWLLVELRVISRRTKESTFRPTLPFHRLAVPVALAVVGLTYSVMFLANVVDDPVGANAVISWLGLLAVVCGTAACLWDPRARWVVASLYLLGLDLLPLTLSYVDVSSRQLVWMGSMAVAAYSVATSYLWSRRRGLASLSARLHVPPRGESNATELRWLVPANCLLVGTVVLLGFWSQLTFAQFSFRLASAQAVIAQAFAVGLLARGRRRSVLQAAALWLGVLGAIAFGWSWLNPAEAANLLNHAVVVAIALGGMSVLYGLGLTKILRRENEWTRAAARTVPALVVLALMAIAGTMAGEIYFYTTQRHVPMSWPAIAAVMVTFVGLAVACLMAAVVPGRDPLGLSERQRTVYVYAAEALLGLLFWHVRLTMPWLFSGFFLRYWPLIVMLIAYLGVGLGEWFQRRRRMVLAEPLEKTGALLPMLPVIGYWVVPGDVHYSLLMLAVGVMYAALSVLRRSFLFGVLAALAANGGLWYLLYRADGLGLLQHPQLWLIPPALCVLAAAYLDRQRLTEAHLTTIRYLCSATIYTSSTADIFLNGVGQAPWLPFVLAGFSIAGMFAGIILRVRSFLFLGASFLLLALMTVIWYAAVDLHQTWLWYVSGIIAGIVILAMFALFEKKRKELLGLVEQLKHWEG